jgi:hypothetical protein
MDDAFGVVAHPQLLVALAALPLLAVVLLIELAAARQAWSLHRPGPAGGKPQEPAPLAPEAYDWLYE